MAKGVKTGGGSRKGVPNKATAEIKAMIEGALEQAGGQAYLLQQAHDNPNAFLTLVGKILPKQVDSTITGDLTVTAIKRIIVRDNARD